MLYVSFPKKIPVHVHAIYYYKINSSYRISDKVISDKFAHEKTRALNMHRITFSSLHFNKVRCIGSAFLSADIYFPPFLFSFRSCSLVHCIRFLPQRCLSGSFQFE